MIYDEVADYVLDKSHSFKSRAKELINYYYNTEDRSGKEFDTLDLTLELLTEFVEEYGR